MTNNNQAFTVLDWLILAGYFVAILATGVYFWRRNRDAEQFTAAGRSLPGWLCGMSIFATYLSSISYLALPGKAFAGNWNAWVFSLSLPIAAWIAVRYFLPLYRSSQSVSAYAWLEERFGLWARLLASGFYLLFQVARIGVVMYLMALPMTILFGWDIRDLILVTGVIVTAYSLVGGITAVIWADAIQAFILLAGALIAFAILLLGLPNGPVESLQDSYQAGKFSLGSYDLAAIGQSTFWLVLAYGLFENLKNFGVDQSYVQRYIAASSDRSAAKSIWLGALLYVPVSAAFFLIGTALYAYYQPNPDQLASLRNIVAENQLQVHGESTPEESQILAHAATLSDQEISDRVFPYFIATQLPMGVRGLLIAAIFAAAMSTVSTGLNSSATLLLSDFYQRMLAPKASQRQQMFVLRATTLLWGTLGTITALIMVRYTNNALDIWWTLSGILGAAIIGLFLLGLTSPRVNHKLAICITLIGAALITWMTLSLNETLSTAYPFLNSPFHKYWIIVLGPCLMILLGWIASSMIRREGDRPTETRSP